MIGSLRTLGRPFLLLWLAETILCAGGAIAEFAVGAWAYRQSGSLFEFSGVIAAGTISTLLVLPLAGVLADRADRRKVILTSDAVMLVCMGLLMASALQGALAVWHLYIFTAVMAMAGACRNPAYRATISALLRTDDLARANGFLGISVGVVSIVSPMIAGAVLAGHDLAGIVAIHMGTVCMSALFVLMAFTRLSQALRVPSAQASAPRPHVLRGFMDALSYFGEHRSMLVLLVYGSVQGCLVALVSSLIAPLVLATYSVRELGVVMTCGGVGALLGALPLFIPGVSRRLTVSLLACDATLALSVFAAGVADSLVQYAACAFVAMFAASVAAGCIHTLWMRKAPLDRQGSLFALIGTIAMVSMPTVALATGIVVDRVLEPALSAGGSWADSIGPWLGPDKGRGVSLIFVICGVLGLVASLGALAHKGVRNIDKLVPDRR